MPSNVLHGSWQSDDKDIKLLNTTLFVMSEALRLAVGLVEPVMPETKEKSMDSLVMKAMQNGRFASFALTDLAGNKVGGKTIFVSEAAERFLRLAILG